jgi:septal ring factor EnvC (AmiA/AmiB activator)
MNWMEIFMGVTAFSSVVTLFYSVSVSRSRASREELGELREEDARQDDELLAHGNRLTTLEAQIQHMQPHAGAIDDIKSELAKLNGNLQHMAGSFAAMREQVGRIDDFLRHK